LADALSTEIYHKGDKIVTEGEQGENFYFIESGSCQVYNETNGPLKTLKKGDYFGEIALLNDLPRQATVEALDYVIVATLGKSGFQRLLGPAVEVLKKQDPTKSQDPTSGN
jgi:cAMP-binding proteins - catabolite gene activator and regulatory subunit of cAMP-dependent protein kinases